MTKELEPCPFCPDGGNPIRTQCGEEPDVEWYSCKCSKCGASVAEYDTPEEADNAWNTRYKRTCRKVPGKMGYQGRKVICSECGYGLGDDRWSFCPKCGAEICGAEVVDGD